MTGQQQGPIPPPGYGTPAHLGRTNEQVQAEKLAQTSMTLGIISIVVLGVILGPIAITKARRAGRLYSDANVGRITGWIGTVLGIIQLLVGIGFGIFYFLVYRALLSTSG